MKDKNWERLANIGGWIMWLEAAFGFVLFAIYGPNILFIMFSFLLILMSVALYLISSDI